MHITDIASIPGVSAEQFSHGIIEVAITNTPVSFTLMQKKCSLTDPFGDLTVGGLGWIISAKSGVGIVSYLGDEKDILPYTKKFFILLHAHNPSVYNLVPLKVLSISEMGDSVIAVNLVSEQKWLISCSLDGVFDILTLGQE